jgi:hypothetical protein
MINQIKASLFLLTLIAFLLSATLGFASSSVKVFENDNTYVLMNDDDKEDDDDDDDDKGKH